MTLPGVLMLVLLAGAGRSAQRPTQSDWQLPTADRVRIAEARRLMEDLGDRIWPGLGRTAMPVLLVTDTVEFLIGHDRPGDDFTPGLHDTLTGRSVLTRPRRMPPTLLATFPIQGVPTVVIGTAERTGKSSTEWVLTLLHEHFHQWQYAQPGYYAKVARLGLAGGDTTGMWMLNYPFPYDSAPVGRAVRRWASALHGALKARDFGPRRLKEIVSAAREARRLLSADDYRYLDFQLWQEGVARYVEYRTALLASESGHPRPDFKALPDYQPYGVAARNARAALLGELERMQLQKNRRVSFYSLGAAMAMLLEEIRPDWRQGYSERPFSVVGLLPDAPAR